MNTIWTDLLGCEVRFRGRDFRTRTLEAGEGEPLVLLHGIGGHAEAYSRNLRRLSGHFRVHAIDLVWHGFSSKPRVPSAMLPVYAAQLLDLMDDLGCARIALEGESLGGWIALYMALHHPDRISAMVLNTAYGVRFACDAVKEDLEAAVQLRDRSVAAISNPTREVVRKRLEWLMASPERVSEELIEVRHAIYNMPDTQTALKSVFATAFDPNREVDEMIRESRLGAIATPTLVLWTDKNPGTGPEGGRRLANLIPGAEFCCVNDAAHWPQWERPEEHDQAVLQFLRKWVGQS